MEYRKVSFEKLKMPSASFDLVIIGTAIHWLDPEITYKKTHKLLKEGGHVAIFWDPIEHLTKKIKELKMKEIFLRNCPNYPINPDNNKIITKRENSLKQHGLFHDLAIKRYNHVHSYSKEEFIHLIKSYSWVISLSKRNQNKLVQEVSDFLGDLRSPIRISKQYCLIMAQRK